MKVKTFNEQFPVSLEENITIDSPRDFLTAYSDCHASLKLFRDALLTQYLCNLPPPYAVTKVVKPFIVGTLVLVWDGNNSRSHWPKAKVIKTYAGCNDILRMLELLLTNGFVLKR